MGRKYVKRAGKAIRDDKKYALLKRPGNVQTPGKRQNQHNKSILLSNIRSIVGSENRCKVKFLSDQANMYNALYICVTESWLNPDVSDSELLIDFPGYNIYRSDRENRLGGGVCIFVREGLAGECLGRLDNGVCQLLINKLHSFL